jgi:N-acyl homoserine lactone hydrolase
MTTTPGPLITGVDFVCVPTDDFDASVKFYGETLGLPCTARYGRMPGAEFQAGNLTLAVMHTDAFGQQFRSNCMPIALQVDDVDAARAHLEAKGVQFTTETFDSGVCYQAIFADPAGNPLDLHHRYAPPTPRSITITPFRVADLLVAEDERMPLHVHVIDHPGGRVLVDTGVTDLHPAIADMDPRLTPLSEQDIDLASIDMVVNTHLHFDHCGGNHLLAGRPFYVQRRELDDARGENYTIPEWVDAPGVEYVTVDGEHELLPGLRLVPAPGHTPGSQMVVVETGGRPIIVGGDVAVRFGELDEPETEGQLAVRALEPELVWLAHETEPWRPRDV